MNHVSKAFPVEEKSMVTFQQGSKLLVPQKIKIEEEDGELWIHYDTNNCYEQNPEHLGIFLENWWKFNNRIIDLEDADMVKETQDNVPTLVLKSILYGYWKYEDRTEGPINDLLQLARQRGRNIEHFVLKWGPMWFNSNPLVFSQLCEPSQSPILYANNETPDSNKPEDKSSKESEDKSPKEPFWLPYEKVDLFLQFAEHLRCVLDLIAYLNTESPTQLELFIRTQKIIESDLFHNFANYQIAYPERETDFIKKSLLKPLMEKEDYPFIRFAIGKVSIQLLYESPAGREYLQTLLTKEECKRMLYWAIRREQRLGIDMTFDPEQNRASFSMISKGGFVRRAWGELAQILCSSTGIYICSKCGQPYFRDYRKPKPGELNYCPKCSRKKQKKT